MYRIVYKGIKESPAAILLRKLRNSLVAEGPEE